MTLENSVLVPYLIGTREEIEENIGGDRRVVYHNILWFSETIIGVGLYYVGRRYSNFGPPANFGIFLIIADLLKRRDFFKGYSLNELLSPFDFLFSKKIPSSGLIGYVRETINKIV